MSDLQITTEMVRAFPFAVAPWRISETDEAWIAADMARKVKDEQFKLGNKPGGAPKEMDPNAAGAEARRARVREAIMRRVRDGREWKTGDLARALKMPLYDVRTACAALCIDGALVQTVGDTKTNASAYQIADLQTQFIASLNGHQKAVELGRVRRERALNILSGVQLTRLQLAECMGIGDRTAQNILADLRNAGLIDAVGRQGTAKLWAAI